MSIRNIAVCPKLKDPALKDAALTQNQWYDLWDGSAVAAGAGSAKYNVRLYALTLLQDVANEDIEIRIIADEVDETVSWTAVAATSYGVTKSDDLDASEVFAPVALEVGRIGAFIVDARSLKIMVRKTTAAGANNTAIKAIWAQW